jgi:hypothetical protein
MLRGMRLKSPFDQLVPEITGFYESELVLWKRMAEIGRASIGGEKPGNDYGKLVAGMAQKRGQVDFIDKALLKATPSVFATLIDMKADSKGHVSPLIIRKEERTKLIVDLNTDFGPKLDAKDQTQPSVPRAFYGDIYSKTSKLQTSDEP